MENPVPTLRRVKQSVVVCVLGACTAAGWVSLASAAAITAATLPNGLQVRIIANDDLALTRVAMVYAAGRGNDPDSLAGLAHFSEHFLTQSSPGFPDGELRRQATLYSTYCNAYTGSNAMGFDTECLPEFLPTILGIEVERLRGSGTNAADFAREKAVVIEELAYRQRRSAASAHLNSALRACYPGHPLGEPIAGSSTSVGRITLADFEAFRTRNIVPRRAALIIEGPVAAEATLALVDSLFADGTQAKPEPLELPPYPEVRPRQIVEDALDFTGVRVTATCRIPQTELRLIALSAALPYLLDDRRFNVRTATVPDERLVQLSMWYVYNRPPADPQQHYGYVYQAFDPDQTAQAALGAVWRELDEALDDLAAPGEFADRLQKAIANAGNFAAGQDAAFGTGSNLVNGEETVTPDEMRELLARLNYAEFRDFAATYLTPARAGVAITHGADSERQQAIELAERVVRDDDARSQDALATLTAERIEPVLAAYGRAGLQPLGQSRLANGIPVITLHLGGDNRLRLGGVRALPPLKIQRRGERPGLVQLYNRVVNFDDRQRRDPDEPDYRPRLLPFSLDFAIAPGNLRFSTVGSSDKAVAQAKQLHRRLESREFNQEKWFRSIRMGRDMLAEIAAAPQVRARAWRLEQVFGHDYWDLGYWEPDPGIVGGLNYKDIVKLHRSAADQTGQTVLIASGGTPPAEVQAALEETFGRRDAYRIYDDEPAPMAPLTTTTGRVFSDPGRGDVTLTVTLPVRPLPAGGVVVELLAETLLRQVLNARLRQAEGLTYGASVSFEPCSGRMLREVTITCQPGQAHLVFAALGEELLKVRTSGCSGDEVARARLALTGRLLRACNDADDGFALLGRLAEFGPPPPDLMTAVATTGSAAIDTHLREALGAGHVAFTATGAILEDDIEAFEIP